MIYVNGVPFLTESSSIEGSDMLFALLEHPDLVSAAHSFHAIPERKFSVSEQTGSQSPAQSKWVYVFQREYAIADPALVEFVGTDEATTCVGMVVRNCKSGMTSIAHLDSPDVVDIGLSQMLSLVSDPDDDDAVLDVHLVGAYEDSAPQVWFFILYFDFKFKDRSSASFVFYFDESAGLYFTEVICWSLLENNDTKPEQYLEMEGYSFPLCIKIVEKLAESKLKFQIQSFQVLKHNTRWDSEGNAYPIFHGLLVETSSGSIVPASFDRSTRCPDEIVRRIRVGSSFEDHRWTGRLLETYETQTDRFVIAPCSWTMRTVRMALAMKQRSDLEILLTTSTSPSAEGPDFVDNQKRVWEYLIRHPDWRETFPSTQPRVFERTASGHWVMSSER